MVSGGCIVSGSQIDQSLLFTYCHTHSYSVLKGVVALPHVVVRRHARLTNVVIDRSVEIPEGLVIGEDPEEDARWFRRSDSGICLVSAPMIERWRAAR
jgi:glucose-1-phosphate adenylyltransferase